MVELFAIAGAAGAALLLLADRRSTFLTGLVVLAVGEVGIAAAAAGHALSAKLAAAGLMACAALAVAALLLARRPAVIPPLILLAAPFRLPLDFGSRHRFFVGTAQSGELGRLLPLYVVLAASLGAVAWRTLRGAPVAQIPRFVAVPTAALLVYAALSLTWTKDLTAGRELLEFFLLPFVAMIAVLARCEFAPWLPRALFIVAVSVASLFAVLALWQAATHKLLFYTPVLEVANHYSPYFRVTSLFRDPSLYGRQVVMGIVVVLVAMWRRNVPLAAAGALVAVLWLGLLFSYSQSSFAALFVAALAVTLVAADARSRRIVALGVAAIVVAGALATGASAIHHSPRKATSDRSRRVVLTVRAWERQPLIGVGLGGQPAASQALADRGGPRPLFVSHTTPLTALTELGVLGFALYAAFLVATARLLLLVYRRDAGLGLTLGGVVLALFVHSLTYSGFFEDPITWFAIGIGVAALAAPVSSQPVPPPAVREPEPVEVR
jgi:hypothetical protein